MASSHFSFRRMARPTALMGCLALSLAACADGSGLSPVPPYDPGQYKLGIDDQLRVMTYGQDQLTSDFRIDSNGKVAFPLTDGLQAAGLTTKEFADEVREALEKSRMLRDPKVSVEITAYRMISVLGEVARPGEYPYQPGMTMLTAIAAAGGFTYRSLESRAYVVRQEGDHTVVGKLKPQDYVKPGDVLKIYERHF
ncbi:polysaccharide biosynthesis/export family protein [Acetobacter oeni]|uniref:Polysaccharide export protein n=1 Tax=Acetobacter oeni TaxID=304077 RepID=A0A511XHM4_9PROT|nr:polysaccharide biosynthesis/export family protein [Acetobacter oeni]MBB3881257.1 polysaccharide export outer membrane protein [Acetobacter oeni]NHO18132.1 polysaccharide export protein [Acetobacter oeni]GBR08191.1 polysaccharide export protein AceH [Acetobacter oeni LMG 21952]GEN62411.1 polysaccharide export protein [Acetobacter oeni]